MGAPCDSAADCDTGLCLDTGAGRSCTHVCQSSEDCDDGLSCETFDLAERVDGGVGETVRACAHEVG